MANKANIIKLLLIFLLLNNLTMVTAKKKNQPGKAGIFSNNEKLPIVYTDQYNIRLFGIQKLHPFDSEKYQKVYNFLKKKLNLKDKSFYKPEIVSRELLEKIHDKNYLNSLKDSDVIAKIAEVSPLGFVPNFILQDKLIKPMKYATGGTILGMTLASKYGWAINLSGGYHHAKRHNGGGFCFFGDIPIAIHELWHSRPKAKILIIDLDAHQGNGFEAIFKNDKRIFILDVYNKDIYPMDIDAQKYIDFKYPISSGTDDSEYLKIIKKAVPNAIKKSRPDFIIYNAGTDIYEKDPLGGLGITEEGIIRRDAIVFENAISLKIPILMVLSGGYHQDSGIIIGKSIENILTNYLKIKKAAQ